MWLIMTICQSQTRATSEVTRDFIAGDSYNSFLLITNNVDSVQIAIFGQRHPFAQLPILAQLSVVLRLNSFDHLMLIQINKIIKFFTHHDC